MRLRQLLDLVPDEWRSAASSYGAMWAVARSTAHGRAKVVFAYLIIMVPVALATYRVEVTVPDGVRGLLLTTTSILAGFVIATILFTGQLPNPVGLKRSDLQAYAMKLRYLVFSQTITLTVYLATIIGAIVDHLLDASEYHVVSSAYLLAFTALALVRTLLLPAQIFEVHDFVLDAAVTAKTKEIADEAERQRRAMIDELDQIRRRAS